MVEYFPLNVSYNFFIFKLQFLQSMTIGINKILVNWHIRIIFNRISFDKMKKQSKRSKSTKGKKSQQKSNPKTKTVAKSKSKNQKKQVQQQVVEKSQKIEQKKPQYTVEESLNNKYKVTLHKNYEIDINSELGKKIKNWMVLLEKKQLNKQKIGGKVYKIGQYSYYPTFEFELAGEKPEHEKCSICQFQYESLTMESMQKQLTEFNNSDLVTLKCSHIMHLECLKQLIRDQDWVKCPVCSTIYGKMIGDQPPGVMSHSVNNLMHCEGYLQCGTITINYNMHAGKRGNISFPGTHRAAYLPDNKQGNQVFKLLKEAFERKLIFTVGRSVTTGRDNQIVWNGIHHKTNLAGGSAYFGYPDPTYFQRVKLELAAKGVY